jgi:hypothetical protein
MAPGLELHRVADELLDLGLGGAIANGCAQVSI